MLDIYQKCHPETYKNIINETSMIEVKTIFLENNNVQRLPVYATSGSAGFDFYSVEDALIKSKDVVVIKTGISLEIPQGFELQVRSRSGLAAKNKIFVLNAPGTIDSDYRGEVCIILANLSDQDFLVSKGDRIAQGVVSRYEKVQFTLSKSLSETDRGSNGFGSSGIK
jgi:dUTP pyrophosphatase